MKRYDMKISSCRLMGRALRLLIAPLDVKSVLCIKWICTIGSVMLRVYF